MLSSSLWAVLLPMQNFIRQTAGIVLLLLLAPLPISLLTALYFAHDLQPAEHSPSEEADATVLKQ